MNVVRTSILALPTSLTAAVASLASRCCGLLIALLAIAFSTSIARAQSTYQDLDAASQGMEVTEHLGQTIPLELQFTNSEGKQVYLKDYFTNTNKPAVVAMVFYKCPVACQVVMQKYLECLNELDLKLGKDFNTYFFSIDPNETPAIARDAKAGFLGSYTKEVTDEVRNAWQFHVGEAAANKSLSDALGFPYRQVADGTYSHPIALFILAPDGKIVRYIHGFRYPPRDIKLALIEASSGRLGKSIGDRLLGFCYMYDPNTGKYTMVARRVMQVGGVFMILAVGSLVGVMLVTERILRRKRAALEQLSGTAAANPADPNQIPASNSGAPSP
jgi:protein SCO1/2